jgi:hypothetical protein
LRLALTPDTVDLAPMIPHESKTEATRIDAADRSQK